MTLETQLLTLFEETPKGGILDKVRAKAWDHYQELGLPSRHQEVYQYVKLRNLYEKEFKPSSLVEVMEEQVAAHLIPECCGAVLVFVNGHYSKDLSKIPKELIACPLDEALKTYSSFLKNHLAKSIKEETDSFAALNTALHKDGLFLYLPPKVCLSTPVQILSLVDSRDRAELILPRVNVFAGQQSEMRLVSKTVVINGSTDFINGYYDFVLDDAAQLHFIQDKDGFADDLWNFDAVRATLKRDSLFKTVTTTRGANTVREDYRVQLTGENGEANLNGLWTLNGKREAHMNVLIDHQAPHCRSFQLFKGVLDEFARSSFEGKIYVHKEAQKTDAFQLNNNLLLSDRANADSKPNLEIFADDVQASHGATVGQPDKEQMFYMKSRGFSSQEGQKFLVNAFCQEVLDHIDLSKRS